MWKLSLRDPKGGGGVILAGRILAGRGSIRQIVLCAPYPLCYKSMNTTDVGPDIVPTSCNLMLWGIYPKSMW